jgi:hypothetical protein
MDDLTGQLEALLRLYAAAFDRNDGDDGRAREQFRRDLELLIARYGRAAVDAALDKLPDEAWPSVSLH